MILFFFAIFAHYRRRYMAKGYLVLDCFLVCALYYFWAGEKELENFESPIQHSGIGL